MKVIQIKIGKGSVRGYNSKGGKWVFLIDLQPFLNCSFQTVWNRLGDGDKTLMPTAFLEDIQEGFNDAFRCVRLNKIQDYIAKSQEEIDRYKGPAENRVRRTIYFREGHYKKLAEISGNNPRKERELIESLIVSEWEKRKEVRL